MTERAQDGDTQPGIATFSPLFDDISRELGRSAASVYGAVWRHCQMRDRVCRASMRRLAGLIGCNVSTVQRQLRRLIREGYLEDTTPGLRNRPHVLRLMARAPVRPERGAQSPQRDL